MTDAVFNRADSICLTAVSIGSHICYLHHYGDKISKAEHEASLQKLSKAINDHVAVCNELNALIN